MEPAGAYRAPRAAALSGVPLSTIHYWARKGHLVPSISAERIKLWSWPDLMGLRLIYWLRSVKEGPVPGREVPSTSMPAVRKALSTLSELNMALWSEDGGPAISVDTRGEVVLEIKPHSQRTSGQSILDTESLELLRPFPTHEGTKGPDLLTPRPTLRIVPGKLAGSPHVHKTRVETVALAALAGRGLREAKIQALYPFLSHAAVRDSIDLENQLRRNINEPPVPIAA